MERTHHAAADAAPELVPGKRFLSLLMCCATLACVRPPSDDTRSATPPGPPPAPPLQAQAHFAEGLSREIVGVLDMRAPEAGSYALAVKMSFDAFITREMRVSEQRTGSMTMTLAPDGTVHGCMGARIRKVVNGQRRYEPPERRRYDEDEDLRLIAFGGAWKVVDGVAQLALDRVAWRTCDLTGASPTTPTTLRCVGVAANDRIPVPSLVCQHDSTASMSPSGTPPRPAPRGPMLELGMHMYPPAIPDGPRETPPTGSNFVFATSGIHLDVEDGSRGPLTFKFRAAPVTLVESDYIRKEEKPTRPR